MNYDAHEDVARLKRKLTQIVVWELEQFRLATGMMPSALSVVFQPDDRGGAGTRFTPIGISVDFTS